MIASSPAGTQPAFTASTVERITGIAAASPAATTGSHRHRAVTPRAVWRRTSIVRTAAGERVSASATPGAPPAEGPGSVCAAAEPRLHLESPWRSLKCTALTRDDGCRSELWTVGQGALVGVVVAVGLAACGSGSSPATSTASSTQSSTLAATSSATTTSSAATTITASSTTPKTDGRRAIGAVHATLVTSHTADPHFASDSPYDPASKLAPRSPGAGHGSQDVCFARPLHRTCRLREGIQREQDLSGLHWPQGRRSRRRGVAVLPELP